MHPEDVSRRDHPGPFALMRQLKTNLREGKQSRPSDGYNCKGPGNMFS